MINEKQLIAGISVIAGIFLTSAELIVRIFTGSLRLLAVAQYSGVNSVTSIITSFSVRISCYPHDKEHKFRIIIA